MTRTRFTTILGVALLLLAAAKHSPARGQEVFAQLRPNHFKVYEITGPKGDPVIVDEGVRLRGQFDRGPIPARLISLSHLANPVEKTTPDGNVSPIRNRHLHYTWYELKQERPEPRRTVTFRNQFGEQKWVIGDAKFLLVPAEKIEKGSQYPDKANHYKCYEVVDPIGQPPKSVLVLADQFVTQKLALGKPRYFCVPVVKFVQRERHPPETRRLHYAVYGLDAQVPRRSVDTSDQFGVRKELTTEKAVLLCVPTRKLGWSAN